MGCGFTVASAIIGDSYKGKQLAKMTTFSAMIYSLSPILAPVLGGYLQHHIGWQANFVFMTIFSILLLIAIIFFIPETNKKPDFNALKCKNLIFNYVSIFKNLNFIGNTATLTFAFGIMITFNVVGPFLLQNVLKVSALTYGQLLLLVGASYFVGTFLNSQLLKFFKINTLIIYGLFLMFIFSIGIILVGYIGWFTVTSIILFTSLEIFSIGFVFPNCFAKALEIFPKNLGVASSLIGSSGLIGTSIISVIVAHIHSTKEHLGYMFLVQTILAMIFFFLSLKPRKTKKYKNRSISK
jgi:DHA1 family 2-module integral membrane pump EmrD-like MFS transporter